MARGIRWQNIFTVSGATLLSRVLGLARDSLTAIWLGLSPAANAFLFAFALPNLFRRLLGEGALSAALLPTLTRVWDAGGHAAGFRLVNQALTRGGALMLLAMGVLAALYGAGLALMEAPDGSLTRQWHLGLRLGLVLVPYLGLVCLAAVFAAALNVRGRFAIPALSAVWLNLALIGSLVLGGWLMGLPPEQLAGWLAIGALAGGAMQLLAPALALWREGWRPALVFSGSEDVSEITRLFVPAVAGAAVGQLNVLVARLAGFLINTQALTALYLANRLVELPLGLFALAITTVAFPELSRSAARADSEALDEARYHGLRLIAALMLPAACGLALLAEPIIAALFGWGRFGDADVAVTAPVLRIFAGALPAYALASFEVRVCHARQDMRAPLKWAGRCLLVNLGLTLALGPWLEEVGLAYANLAAAWTQALGLHFSSGRVRGLFRPLAQILLAVIAMSLVCHGLLLLAKDGSPWLILLVTIPGSICAYGGALTLFGLPPMSLLQLATAGRPETVKESTPRSSG